MKRARLMDTYVRKKCVRALRACEQSLGAQCMHSLADAILVWAHIRECARAHCVLEGP